MARIPATVVTGFLGTGKTTLIRHLTGAGGGPGPTAPPTACAA